MSLVALLAAEMEHESKALDPDGARRVPNFVLARRLVARMAAGPTDGERSAASVAGRLLLALGAARVGEEPAAALNRALVLLADHELNASTFAARVAAGAGAGLGACLCAALSTLSGVRHGGECDRVEALVAEVAAGRRASAVVGRRRAQGQVFPGFAHPLYPAGDPRAAPLLDAARALSPRATRAVDALLAAAEDALGVRPTVDAALVALAAALGLRAGGASAVFAVGRSAGWIAHVFEQWQGGYLLRPRARYVGAAASE